MKTKHTVSVPLFKSARTPQSDPEFPNGKGPSFGLSMPAD